MDSFETVLKISERRWMRDADIIVGGVKIFAAGRLHPMLSEKMFPATASQHEIGVALV